MGIQIDITGRKFGKLEVIKFSHKVHKEKGSVYYWYVRCDCGNEFLVIKNNLIKGSSKSCRRGLCAKRKYKSLGESVTYTIKNSYIRNAKKRGLEWLLTDEEFSILTLSLCFYCGIEPTGRKIIKNVINKRKQFCTVIMNGIDRLDSSLGYTKDNCVSSCTNCNYAKSDLTHQQFIDHIFRIHAHITSL